MNRLLFIPFLFPFLISSCEEKAEPLGTCEDNQWTRFNRNGEERCLGAVEVNYFHANTNSAKVILSARDEDAVSLTPEIYVEFSIPVEGAILNTPYPVIAGKILDADEITEGSLTLLVFDPPSSQKSGCVAGTFTLKAEAGGVTTFEYTDGKFVFSKGQGADNYYAPASCNPF